MTRALAKARGSPSLTSWISRVSVANSLEQEPRGLMNQRKSSDQPGSECGIEPSFRRSEDLHSGSHRKCLWRESLDSRRSRKIRKNREQLNRGRLKPGPCFRGRFDNIKRTGRTGCVSPNLQNYPSRDKIYPLKNIFTARNGRVLCATDFSFIESTRLN